MEGDNGTDIVKFSREKTGEDPLEGDKRRFCVKFDLQFDLHELRKLVWT